MKRRVVLLMLLILAIGLLSYLAACSLLGVSVDERVNRFLADINNGDYGQVYLNFDPNILDWPGIQVAAFWDTKFPPGNAPFSIASLASSDPSNVTFTISAAAFATKNVKFVMQKSGMDWMIIEMYMDPFPTAPTTPIVQ